MDYTTLENSDITSLLKGYEENHGSYICLWCGEVFYNEAAVVAHLESDHTQDSRFYQLMSADSLLNFSHTEKIIYQRLYEGVSDKQIADEVGLQYSTVRAMKRDYHKSFMRAKINLLFGSILFDKQPKRKYNKKDTDKAGLLDFVPWLADDGESIRGFFPKSVVHDPTNPKRHPTTLILILKQPMEAMPPVFLIGNRSDKLRQSWLSEAPSLYAWDVCGGHVALEDFNIAGVDRLRCAENIPCHSLRLTDEVYRNTALRELKEEICWKDGSLDPAAGLKFLFSISYEADWSSADRQNIYGRNVELTHVYKYMLPKEAGDTVKMRDDYMDSLGKKVKRDFPVKYISYQELMSDYYENPSHYMDGLSRILALFKDRQYTDDDVNKLLMK